MTDGERLEVRKTYKLFVNGAFPRSESGRAYRVTAPDGSLLAWAAQASRKDLRDAVVAARAAWPGWAQRTAYNRGQVLYRVAEVLEGRRAQLADEVRRAGASGDPDGEVADAVDCWVWYAGWSDKIHHVAGTVNAVAGPYFNFSIPEPMGVVGIVAPEAPALAGLVARLAPALAGGNVAVVVASEAHPLAAVTLAEVLATSDVPAGVVNILTGVKAELLPWLAGHRDVDAVDLTGAPEAELGPLETLAADNVKRVVRATAAGEQTPYAVTDLMEIKTVWHPIGA